MSLKEDLDYISKYTKIIVTGPQRSGTRIATKIISEELGLEFLDEDEAAGDFAVKFLENTDRNGYVLQCPGVSHLCHINIPKDMLVVFMRRDVKDIIQSDEYRVKTYKRYWNYKPVLSTFINKFRCYSKHHPSFVKDNMTVKDVPIITYDVWDNYQKLTSGLNYYDLNYNSLSDHSLWLPLEERRKEFRHGTQIKRWM